MASIIDRIKNDLLEAINASQRKTSAYDTEAEVVRIEGNTAWVHIGGGVAETPVQLTINAQKGDKVQVRVSNEGAWIMGNATAPPTDDTKAEEAKQEIVDTNVIVKAVKTMADRAVKIAGNTNQYFWHTQEGTDTGAHITEIPQEEFLADPSNGGGNLLARSNGIAVRDGLTELAQFGQNGIVVGEIDSNNIRITNTRFSVTGAQSQKIFDVENALSSNTTTKQQAGKFTSKYSSSETTVTVDFPSMQIESCTVSIKLDGSAENFVSQNITIPNSGTVTFSIQTEGGITIKCWYTAGTQKMRFRSQSNTEHTFAYQLLYSGYNLAPVLTFGYRDSSSTLVGAYSCALGDDCGAKASYSFAAGSHAIAEGRGSSAHGEAVYADGADSHAFGINSFAKGNYSVVMGNFLRAYGKGAVAIGKCNDYGTTVSADAQGDYAFMIGNGTSDNARSNALAVAWNGNTTIAGTLTQGSDRRLKDHIAYLDEDAIEFVRQLKPAHYIKDGADHVGFYAQDVELADKWNCMVGEMNGFKTLGYTELIAPLVAYCQSLEKRIEELEGE